MKPSAIFVPIDGMAAGIFIVAACRTEPLWAACGYGMLAGLNIALAAMWLTGLLSDQKPSQVNKSMSE